MSYLDEFLKSVTAEFKLSDVNYIIAVQTDKNLKVFWRDVVSVPLLVSSVVFDLSKKVNLSDDEILNFVRKNLEVLKKGGR